MHNAPMSALVWFTFSQVHPRLSKLVPASLAEWSNITSSSRILSQDGATPSSSSSSSASSKLLPLAAYSKWNLAELSVVFLSASLSGGFASMMTLPLDVLKTRLQNSDRMDATVRNTWTQLRNERGWKGFMAGWRPRLTTSAFQSGMLMTLYEVLKRVCVREGEDAHRHTP
jgi:hypothetical protein